MAIRKRNPYDGPPDPPDDPPPKSHVDPGAGGHDTLRISSDNGRTVPTIHGTIRATAILVERYAYAFESGATLPRFPSTSYAIGTVRRNVGNLYVVTAITTGITGTGAGPTGTGSGIVDGGVTWDYVKYGFRHLMAMLFCEGLITGAGKAWQEKNAFAAYTDMSHDSNFFDLHLGTATETRASSNFWPTDGTTLNDVYGNLAVLYGQMTSGSDADIPTVDVEIKGIGTASVVDVNPADIAIDMLTHARRGAGWPSAMVDAVSTGSATASSWWNYCKAAGFIFSWNIDSQQSARSLLKTLLAASNTEAVWTNRADGSGGMLKFVPLGTDAITANGATFTPNLTPAFALTPDDFLDPIEVDTIQPTETYNSMPIEYIDRATDYKRLTVMDNVMEDIDVRGLARANTIAIPMVMSPDAAIQLSRIMAQRSLNVANTWRMRVGYRFLLVEPTDLLTDTDGLLGVNAQPVRVTVFEEDQSGDGSILLEAEDFPAAVGAAKPYTPQVNDGFKPAVETAVGALVVIPANVPANGVIPAQSLTISMRNFHNLWPNPTSEIDPFDGVVVPNDGSSAEFDFRANVGPSPASYAGTWVRKFLRTTAGTSSMKLVVPASPGEWYIFRAQHRWISTSGTPTAGMKCAWLDKDGNALSGSQTLGHPTTDTSYTAGEVMAAIIAPADTAYAEFSFILTTAASGTAEIRWDALSVFRALLAADFLDNQIPNSKVNVSESARARRSTAQSIPNATFTTIIFLTEDYDGFSRYDAGSGIYVANQNAKYRISAGVTLDCSAHDVTEFVLTVTVNGTEVSRLGRVHANTDLLNTHYLDGLNMICGSTTAKLSVGDQVEIKAWQSNVSAGSINTEANAISNWICVEELFGPKYGA
jgi:hypothetical protein